MREIDLLIFSIIEDLKKKGTITYDTDFCELVELKKQNFQRIKKGDVHFTVKHIDNLTKKFNVDPRYLFGYSDKMYMNLREIKSTMQNDNTK